MNAAAKIRELLAIARDVADPSSALGKEARNELAAVSPLSREGIDLALANHLETNATDDDIAALVATVTAAPRCHVVLSASVCTAALRAIAIACATSEDVSVKPSRRDPVLAEILCREAGLKIVADVDPRAGDQIHVYGRDETIAAIASKLGEGVVLRGHGAGIGLAIVEADADLDAAASAIARDVVPFDQAGCLSPRHVLCGGDRAVDLARAIERALSDLGRRVPRGRVHDAESIALYRRSMEAIGSVFIGDHHVVGVDDEPRAMPLPPAARIVHVAAATPATVEALVAPWSRFITTIGTSRPGGALTGLAVRLAPRARVASLGAMQRPPLDGPVDWRGAGVRRSLDRRS